MLGLEMPPLKVKFTLGKKKTETMNRVKTYRLITNVQVRINAPNFAKHTTMQHIIVII